MQTTFFLNKDTILDTLLTDDTILSVYDFSIINDYISSTTNISLLKQLIHTHGYSIHSYELYKKYIEVTNDTSVYQRILLTPMNNLQEFYNDMKSINGNFGGGNFNNNGNFGGGNFSNSNFSNNGNFNNSNFNNNINNTLHVYNLINKKMNYKDLIDIEMKNLLKLDEETFFMRINYVYRYLIYWDYKNEELYFMYSQFLLSRGGNEVCGVDIGELRVDPGDVGEGDVDGLDVGELNVGELNVGELNVGESNVRDVDRLNVNVEEIKNVDVEEIKNVDEETSKDNTTNFEINNKDINIYNDNRNIYNTNIYNTQQYIKELLEEGIRNTINVYFKIYYYNLYGYSSFIESFDIESIKEEGCTINCRDSIKEEGCTDNCRDSIKEEGCTIHCRDSMHRDNIYRDVCKDNCKDSIHKNMYKDNIYNEGRIDNSDTDSINVYANSNIHESPSSKRIRRHSNDLLNTSTSNTSTSNTSTLNTSNKSKSNISNTYKSNTSNTYKYKSNTSTSTLNTLKEKNNNLILINYLKYTLIKSGLFNFRLEFIKYKNYLLDTSFAQICDLEKIYSTDNQRILNSYINGKDLYIKGKDSFTADKDSFTTDINIEDKHTTDNTYIKDSNTTTDINIEDSITTDNKHIEDKDNITKHSTTTDNSITTDNTSKNKITHTTNNPHINNKQTILNIYLEGITLTNSTLLKQKLIEYLISIDDIQNGRVYAEKYDMMYLIDEYMFKYNINVSKLIIEDDVVKKFLQQIGYIKVNDNIMKSCDVDKLIEIIKMI